MMIKKNWHHICVSIVLSILLSCLTLMPTGATGAEQHDIDAQNGHWTEQDRVFFLEGTSSGLPYETILSLTAVNRNTEDEFSLPIIDHHYAWDDIFCHIGECSNTDWWVTVNFDGVPSGEYFIIIDTSINGVADTYGERQGHPACAGEICIGG